MQSGVVDDVEVKDKSDLDPRHDELVDIPDPVLIYEDSVESVEHGGEDKTSQEATSINKRLHEETPPTRILYGSNFVYDSRYGVVVDRDTGVIMNDVVISDGPEWRSFRENGVKGLVRSSTPLDYTRHDHGVHVEFGFGSKRAKGSPRRSILNYNIRSGLAQEKIVRKEIIARTCANRALKHFEGINTHTEQIVHYIIGKYFEVKKSRKENVTEREARILAAAAVITAVRLTNLPVPRNKILEYFRDMFAGRLDVSKDLEHEIWTMMRKLSEYGIKKGLMRIIMQEQRRRGGRYLFDRVKTFVRLIVSELEWSGKYPGLDQRLANATIDLLETILYKSGVMKPLPGKKPEAIAAAAVYLTARLMNFDVSQKEVADIVWIKESNVRKAFRFLIEDLTIMVYL